MESLFLAIIVAKYLNIFPHANNGSSREKKSSGKRVLAAALVLSHALQQTTHITQFSKNEHFCQGISPQFLAPSWGLGQDIVLV